MLLSLVIAVFDEEDALPRLLEALGPVLASMDCDHEVVFIDDDSRDRTRALLAEAARADPRVRVLGFRGRPKSKPHLRMVTNLGFQARFEESAELILDSPLAGTLATRRRSRRGSTSLRATRW